MFSVSHDDVYVLTTQNPDYNLKYIYNFIKANMNLVDDSFKGSTIKHCSKTALSNIRIRIPKNKQLIQELEATFKQIETFNDEVKRSDELHKQYIQELSQEAFPQQQTNATQTLN